MAICTKPAAMGAKNIIASEAIIPGPFSLRPPKSMPKFAIIEMAPAKVAVMVMISVSRFLI